MNDALFERVKNATYSGNDVQIRAIYYEVFGTTIKRDCGNCYNEAVFRLHSWLKSNKMEQPNNNKWKFKDEFKGKTVVVKVGGVNTAVTADNLTDNIAEMLISMGRGNNLELNKGYKPDAGEVKKITPEVFKNAGEKKENAQPHTLSTLKSAQKDLSAPLESVKEKELIGEELKPLPEQTQRKKRGRPSSK